MEKKSRKSIIIGIISLFLVMLILVGLTYAYYRTRIIGNESIDPSISVQSKKMEIVYEDGTSEMNMTGKIEPGFTATKTFSVENTGDQTVNYSIVLDNVTNTYTRKGDWTYALTQSGVTEPLASGTVPSSISYIVSSTSIASKTKNTYTLTITYAKLDNVDQSDDMGKSLSFRVNIGAEVTVWDAAQEGTLLYAIKNNNPVTTEVTGLSSAEDDYGISYYFRGNVANNFVTFSGMCWRIVRVQGNGGIKLVLADSQNVCEENNPTGYSTENESAYSSDMMMPWADSGCTSGDGGYQCLAYNEYSSVGNELSNFESKLDTSNLTSSRYCTGLEKEDIYYAITANGDVVYEKDDPGFSSIDGVEYYTYTDEFYSAYQRLFENSEPTFKCGMDYSTYNAYILTADEIEFARLGSQNSYLNVNANSIYWTTTPAYYEWPKDMSSSADARIFAHSNGNLELVSTIDTYAYVRPVIVLKKDAKIEEGGNGTQATPYVIS